MISQLPHYIVRSQAPIMTPVFNYTTLLQKGPMYNMFDRPRKVVIQTRLFKGALHKWILNQPLCPFFKGQFKKKYM